MVTFVPPPSMIPGYVGAAYGCRFTVDTRTGRPHFTPLSTRRRVPSASRSGRPRSPRGDHPFRVRPLPSRNRPVVGTIPCRSGSGRVAGRCRHLRPVRGRAASRPHRVSWDRTHGCRAQPVQRGNRRSKPVHHRRFRDADLVRFPCVLERLLGPFPLAADVRRSGLIRHAPPPGQPLE